MAAWQIHKDESGATFWLQVGHVGVPGSVAVRDLTRKQAQELGSALVEIERRAEYEALDVVRRALGIKQ